LGKHGKREDLKEKVNLEHGNPDMFRIGRGGVRSAGERAPSMACCGELAEKRREKEDVSVGARGRFHDAKESKGAIPTLAWAISRRETTSESARENGKDRQKRKLS